MTDREKVIRAMEYCTAHVGFFDENDECLGDVCPFKQDGYESGDCQENMIRAALALLKEQEARVMSWEEVDKSGNLYVWAEIRSFITDEKALIYCKILNSVFFHGIYRLREESGVEWTRTKEDYNRDDSQGSHSGWRCWTARPTEEQRKAVMWDD